MKVAQINVLCDHGSTGVIVVEIADLLRKLGHESFIAYGQDSTTYPNSFRIGTPLENRVHALLYSRILGMEGSGTKCGTKKLVKWLDEIKPDVVHLHTFHSNYCNYEILFSYLREKQIPVVWSFYDCWPFTGKCGHFAANGCRKWETECGNCPQLHTSGFETWFFDNTKKLQQKKKEWFTNLKDLNIIVCSEWLKREVEKSFFKGTPIHMIYNWIDTAKFEEVHDSSVYEKYGLNPNKKILLSVSADWFNGNSRFIDACNLANILPNDYQLVIVGKKDKDVVIPNNIIYIPFVAGTTELSKLYSAALAYVNFSVQDTFGKVIAEAMLCGTPAIVFDATACPEVVGDVGYAVPPHDVETMLEKVKEIEKNGRSFYSQRCKDLVTSRYGYEQNVSKIMAIYEQMLNKQ